MIFYNCLKLFVTNQSVALLKFPNVKSKLVNACFFLTFATQKFNSHCREGGKNGKDFNLLEFFISFQAKQILIHL